MSYPKLFVTDLDSTALGGGHRPYARFPDVFSEFLDELDGRGCRWAINSTWDVHGQWELVLGSAVQSRPLFLMGEIGHQLATIDGGEPVFAEPFTSDTKEKMAEVKDRSFYPVVKDISGKFCPRVSHFYGHWFEFNVVEKEKSEFVNYVSEECDIDGELACRDHEDGITVYPAFLKKSRNLREALKIGNFDSEDVVVAGDEVADTEMMSEGLSCNPICPANANSVVKEHVIEKGGVVGEDEYAEGVIMAFGELAEKKNWT